jgi:lysophospholipase L1-like esterase
MINNRLIAFGDSITKGFGVPEGAGWIELIAKCACSHFGQTIEVINAGGNGNTSSEGLARFSEEVAAFLPGTVLIEFGGNDPVLDEIRHVSPDFFAKNIEAMISAVRTGGGECILATFPVIVDEHHSTSNDPIVISRGGMDRMVEPYRELMRESAEKFCAPLLDLDGLSREWIKEMGRENIIDADGVHWTKVANQLACDAALCFFKRLMNKKVSSQTTTGTFHQ